MNMLTFSGAALLFPLSAGIPALFYIAALIFVITRKIDRNTARKYLICGVSLLLIQSAGGFVAQAVISRFTTPNNLTVLGVYSLLSALMSVLAIASLIAASVTGRHRTEAEQRFVPSQANNPYTTPQS